MEGYYQVCREARAQYLGEQSYMVSSMARERTNRGSTRLAFRARMNDFRMDGTKSEHLNAFDFWIDLNPWLPGA